ncbi:EF hand protein (macronuclear) [Tetrahymena thermophila SB210]|uniref:EF hand protein n=1 Tax=Tetrahymena thermophila (strain SB210) TaxID=312017 RepID=I7LXX7_TETTS|nr:EF hand protein [Tetrahymena thermophila SB210]EAS06730.2 EF hand protein [Tetrahymena thermophila SB210]|eukprot:XP_001026972.2 EF hand protein [Tetrahymena thermophila SB210]
MHKNFNVKQQIYNSIDRKAAMIDIIQSGNNTFTCTNSMFQSAGKFSTTFQTPRLDKTGSSINSDFNFFRSRSNVYHNNRDNQFVQSSNPSYRSIGVTRFESPNSNIDQEIEESRSVNSNNNPSIQILQNSTIKHYYQTHKQNKIKIAQPQNQQNEQRYILDTNNHQSSNLIRNKQMTKLNHLLTSIKQPINRLNSPLLPTDSKQNFYQTDSKSSKCSVNLNAFNQAANSQNLNNLSNAQDQVAKQRLTFQEFRKIGGFKEKNIQLASKFHKRSISNPQNPYEEQLKMLDSHKQGIQNLTFRENNIYQLQQFQQSQKQSQNQREIFLINFSECSSNKIQVQPYIIQKYEQNTIDYDDKYYQQMQEMFQSASFLFQQQIQYAFLLNECPISLLQQIPDHSNCIILSCKPRPFFWKKILQLHKIENQKSFQTIRDDVISIVNNLKTEEEIIHFLKNPKNYQLEKKRKVYSILETFCHTNKSSIFQNSKNYKDFSNRNTQNFEHSLSRSNSKADSMISKKIEEDFSQANKVIERKFEIQYPLIDYLAQNSGRLQNQKQKIYQEVSKIIEEHKKKNLITDEQIKKQEEDFQMSKSPITGELLDKVLQEIPKKKPNLLYFNKQQLLKLKIKQNTNQFAIHENFYQQKQKNNSIFKVKVNSNQKIKQSTEEKNMLDQLFNSSNRQKTPDGNKKNYLEMNKNKYQNILEDINHEFPNLVAHNIPKIEKKTGLTRQQLHLMFSKFKSLLHYKYLYNNNKMQTAKETVKNGFDTYIFKKGIPKLNIAPDHAVEKLFYDKNKNSDNTSLLWEQFLSALIILESQSEDSKIDLFLRIIDSNQNGYLSFEEIFNASREVFKQILCEIQQGKAVQKNNFQRQETKKIAQFYQKTRSQLIEDYKISGDQFNYLEMSEFLTRYIFDYLNCPYDQEINTQLVRSKLSDQSKELDLLLMICFQDINQQPREEYDNQSDEEDFKLRKEEEKNKYNQQKNETKDNDNNNNNN